MPVSSDEESRRPPESEQLGCWRIPPSPPLVVIHSIDGREDDEGRYPWKEDPFGVNDVDNGMKMSWNPCRLQCANQPLASATLSTTRQDIQESISQDECANETRIPQGAGADTDGQTRRPDAHAHTALFWTCLPVVLCGSIRSSSLADRPCASSR